MISFYPGPSRVYDEIPKYVRDAHDKGILSLNHRSEEFVKLYRKTVALLQEKLNIPETHTILFTSSATECWEVLAQSLITKESLHIYNGSFGEKWFSYTKKLVPAAKSFSFDKEKQIEPAKLPAKKYEVLCLTHNETSNGTTISNATVAAIRKKNPTSILAVDATSSMAGVTLDYKLADIWFASVQKCFGLPAGLGIMICSPRAVTRIRKINERNHYNSLPFMLDIAEQGQTSFTPNVLGIYLLMRVLKDRKPINEVHQKIKSRAAEWNDFFKASEKLKVYVRNNAVRSLTVVAITGQPAYLATVKKTAKEKGFLLGEGYGALKKDTFRIANFPAIKQKEIKALRLFLQKFT